MVGTRHATTGPGRAGTSRRLVAAQQSLATVCVGAIVYRSSEPASVGVAAASRDSWNHVIEAQDLTKRYGDKIAVDHLSFRVEAGRVTGFLGPNGAGKSTTMRAGARPGTGRPVPRSPSTAGRTPSWPGRYRTVGALLEARAMHPGRSARSHLLFLAQTQGVPRPPGGRGARLGRAHGATRARANEDQGLPRWGWRASGWASRRRCWATRSVLVLDEPVNGLDPEGILWIRNLMKHLRLGAAHDLRVPGHLMNEMAVTADPPDRDRQGGKLIAESTTPGVHRAEFGEVRCWCARRPQARSPT